MNNFLGQLLIKLGLEPSNFEKGLNGATQKLTMFKVKTLETVAETKEGLNTVAEGLMNLQTVLAGVVGAGIFEGVKKLVEAWNDHEVAVTKLNAALQATGRYSAEASEAIQKSSDAIQKQTTYSHDAVNNATATLAIFAKALKPQELAQAQTAVVGLSAALGKDLNSSALLVGKALSGNVGILQRFGVTLHKTGDEHQRLAELIQKTNAMYEVAKAKANTTEGAYTQFTNSLVTLEEQFGHVIETGLDTTKNLHDMRDELDKDTDSVKNNQEALARWVQALALIPKTMINVISILATGFLYVIGGFQKGLLSVVQGVSDTINIIVKGAIFGINQVITAANRIPGVHIDQLKAPQIPTGGMKDVSSKMDVENDILLNARDSFAKNIANDWAALYKPLNMQIHSPSGKAGPYDGSSPGTKAKKAKEDPDIARAKELIKQSETPLEKYQQDIAEADRLLKKHLITLNQWREIVDKAEVDTNKMIKINPNMDELTLAQSKRVDLSKRKDYGFGTSPDLKTAMDKFVKIPLDEKLKENENYTQDQLKLLDQARSYADNAADAFTKYTQAVSDLNHAYSTDSGLNMTQEEYNAALEKLKEQFLPQLYPEITQYKNTVKDLDSLLKGGKITQDEYNQVLQTAKDQAFPRVIQQTELYNTAIKKLNEDLKANVINQSQYNVAVKKAYLDYKTNFTAVSQAVNSQLDSIGASFTDTFVTGLSGGKANWGSFFHDMLVNIAKLIIQLMIVGPLIDKLKSGLTGTNAQGQQTGAGGWIGAGLSLLGSLAGIGGGGAALGSAAALGGGAGVPSLVGALGLATFADGGNYQAGKLRMVGENGPELEIPGTGGTIVSNKDLAGALGGDSGSVGLTQQFTIQANDAKGFRELLMREKTTIQRMALDGVQKAQNKRGRKGPLDKGR